MHFFFLKECNDDYFGQNCRERCNETCKSCNKTTGVCDNGCHPGWEGLYCQQGKTYLFNCGTGFTNNLLLLTFAIYLIFTVGFFVNSSFMLVKSQF